MAKRRTLTAKASILLTALALLSFTPARAAQEQDLNAYKFADEDGNQVVFPSDLPLYWNGKPGPWKGLEAAHDVTLKARTRREGLEMSRIMNIRISHKDTEGKIKAIYVLDKDGFVIGYKKFPEKAGNELETEILITSVINYVEICIECTKHGMWKKVYRFI